MALNNSSKDDHYKVDPQHPYPALHSFREEDRKYFFGRDREINELVHSIKGNVLIVVLGKSGIGKTSLLQAGLMPRLRRNYYLPIYMRIRFDDDKKSPIEQVKVTIESEIKELDKTAISFNDLTLWEYFYNVRILEGHVKPLLFFDQFEEFFTGGKQNPEKVDPLVTEIGDLVQNWLPVAVQEKFKDQSIPYSNKKPNYRVIFSLREEYLPQLKNLSSYMPSIVNGRYHFRVQQMKGEDAIDAVLKPGKEIIKNREVAIEIVRKIPESEDADYKPYEEQNGSWEDKKIEPFLLSLFSYEINKKRLDVRADEISRELVKDVNAEDIMIDFYEKNISQFEPNVKIAIEDLLLTLEGYRRLQVMNSLKTEYGVTVKDIEGLVDRRIIRQETRMGIDYIELIHDRLAPILKESRDKRKEEKKRQKELKEKKKIYGRIIITIIGIAVVILAGLTWYAFDQKARAEKESRNNKAYELAAHSTNWLDKDPTLSFRLAESAYQMEKANPDAYNALLHAFYTSEFYQVKEFSEHTSEKSDFFAAFSHDGSLVLTANSQKVLLWNLSDNNTQYTQKKVETMPIWKPFAAFSPDGKYIVIIGPEEENIRLLNSEGKQIEVFKGHAGVKSIAFSHDSKNIITSRGNNAWMWDLKVKGALPAEFKGHKEEVNYAAFSPKGGYVVTASWDKTARLWDMAGNREQEFKGHTDSVNTAVFSPGGKNIVTASKDETARLWDLEGNQIRAFEGHTGPVKSAMFSPDGKYIITASEDKTARLWDLNGIQVFEFKEFNDIIRIASFSPKTGKYILIVPAKGPAHLRLVNPGIIIEAVNKQNVWQLDEETKKKYNIEN